MLSIPIADVISGLSAPLSAIDQGLLDIIIKEPKTRICNALLASTKSLLKRIRIMSEENIQTTTTTGIVTIRVYLSDL